MPNTKFTSGGNEVTFTVEPSFSPDRTYKVRLSRGVALTLADGQPVGHTFDTVSPWLHHVVWSVLPLGSETGTGGEDMEGLIKFYHLEGGAGASIVYTDVDNAAHTVTILTASIARIPLNPNGAHFGPVELDLLEYA